jgi:tetratricopeptide (TPR) repeat protein
MRWGSVLALLAVAAPGQYVGSKSCVPCHPAQYRGFPQTPMGRSLAAPTPTAAPEFNKPVQFFHPKTGRRYRVFRKQSEFLIEEFFLDQNRRLVYSDPRSVRYAIGSGNHARSFLVERSARLYQAPVTFFRQAGHWDMSPGYDTDDYVGFTRQVTTNCLFCHGGDSSQPAAAIGCERCHGPGKQHLAQPGKAIVHPARLAPELRDQVCEQCHLFGAARVAQPGRSAADYRPGEQLGAVLAIFAHDAAGAGEPSVTGHPQEMKQSVCWQKSPGKLWCGSCHEVHTKAPVDYRAKCLACHQQAHHRENDCIACHMPKRPVTESAHVAFTDHRILREPQAARQPEPTRTKLKLILPADLDDPVVATRNLGFAYAELASSTGREEFHRKVLETLQPLVGTSVVDATFWLNLGEAHLALGEVAESEAAFQKAVELDSGSAGAHYGLGYTFQLLGQLPKAIQAYRRALQADPDKAEAWGNLAAAYSKRGDRDLAVKAWDAAIRLEPGNLRWRAAKSVAASTGMR